MFSVFFFFKQKTAYELRISDWSSDVCSSDLERRLAQAVDDYKAFFGGRAKSIEAALADGREWLVAGRFTIADIAIGYAAFLATTLGADDMLGDATRAWLDRCTARAGFRHDRARQKAAA